MATAALALMLAVPPHNLIAKDRFVRQGRWEGELALMGRGLTGRTVGTFGLGNVALELFELLGVCAEGRARCQGTEDRSEDEVALGWPTDSHRDLGEVSTARGTEHCF